MSRILVIDDEQGISELICETLQQIGFTVETAFTGQEGIRCFDAAVFDLVVTDMGLPDMNGRAVIRHIRNSSRSFTPIIGISGTPWLLQGADCDAALPKPFPLRALIELVRRMTRISFTGASPRSTFCQGEQPVAS